MTLTPDQRAAALLADLVNIRWPSEAEALPLIAEAIRVAYADGLREGLLQSKGGDRVDFSSENFDRLSGGAVGDPDSQFQPLHRPKD